MLIVIDCSKATAQDSILQPGTWDAGIVLRQVIARESGTNPARSDVSMAGIQVMRVMTGPAGCGWARGLLEYGVEVRPVFVTTSPQVVYGGGFDAFLFRWNFVRPRRIQPYFDLAGGIVFTTRNIPPGNTSSINFVPRAETGLMFHTRSDQATSFGLGFWHFSNAYLGNSDPGLNGFQFTIGYHWLRFK